MKKKLLFLVMSICILMLAGGCAKKGVADDLNSDKTSDTTDSQSATDTTAPVKEDYVVSDYITLGNYKGVEVTVDKLEVTEDDIDAKIQSDLEANATQEDVTGRPVQDKDVVNIDYEGLKDGVAFEGGTAQGVDLTIGSGSFIEGFEEGLIGANIGDKLELNLTFPEDYSQSPDLAGQAVVFNVTINSIKKSTVPELTEDYVKGNTDYDTIDAYREGVRKDLETQNQETMDNQKIENVLKAIVDNSKITYPQTLLDYYSYSFTNYYTQMYYYLYGMTLEDYLAQSGSTMDEFNTYAQQAAEYASSMELVKKAVAETEKMSISDDEYKEKLPEFLENYGYETEEDLLAVLTKDQIKEELLLQKAQDFVVGQAVVK
jgi:trigger factor